MSNEKLIINKQFVKAFNELKGIGIIESKSQLARDLKTYNHVIGGILKGERSLTLDQLERFVVKYKLNAKFFFSATQSLFIDSIEKEERTENFNDYLKILIFEMETFLDVNNPVLHSNSFKKIKESLRA